MGLNFGSDGLFFNYSFPVEDLEPDQFTFIDLDDQPRSTFAISAPITVTGVTPGRDIPISITNGFYSVNGAAFTPAVGVVQINNEVRVLNVTSIEYSTPVDTIVNISGVIDTFTSTTEASPPPEDITPDDFFFGDLINQERSTLVTSNAIVVEGVVADTDISISVTGGSYSVNSGDFTAIADNVQLNDTVRVQHTTSPDYEGIVNTTLNISGVNDTFTSTGKEEPYIPPIEPPIPPDGPEGEPGDGEIMKNLAYCGENLWSFRDLEMTSAELFTDEYWSNSYASSMMNTGDLFLIAASDKTTLFTVTVYQERRSVILSTGLEIN